MIDDALKRYYDHFGENYPLMIVDAKTDREIIEDINRCIETNTKAKEPVYDDKCDY